MSSKENNTQSQEPSDQWLQYLVKQGAINSGLVFALIMSLAIYSRILLKIIFRYKYSVDKVPTVPLILTTLGLLLSLIVVDVVLLKFGCPKSIRSGIWFGLSFGPLMGLLMFERGSSLFWSIIISVVSFVLAFTAVYLLEMRQNKIGK